MFAIEFFTGIDRTRLIQATLMLLFSFLIVVTRWWRLLAVSGCPTTWWNALRLTFIGMFFNLVVPGLTGGDVIKAVVDGLESQEEILEIDEKTPDTIQVYLDI